VAPPLHLPKNALGTLTVRSGAVYMDTRRYVVRIGPSVARVRLARTSLPGAVQTVFTSAGLDGGGHTATGHGAVWVAHTNRIVRVVARTGARTTLHPGSRNGIF